MKNRKIMIGCLIACILAWGHWPSSAFADTKVLSGKHVMIYDIVNPQGVEFLPNYANNSFSQKVIQEDEFSKRILVEVNLTPLNSKASFPLPPIPVEMKSFLIAEKDIPADEKAILQQAQRLVQNSRSAHEAVSAIINWIVDSHTYDAGRNTPQDGRFVFFNKRGSCVGYSNLVIAMLRGVGIPARYAHGYLPPGYDWGISKKYWGVQINGGGYHAWVEIFYPDLGWTFSDLLHSKDFVDPFHVLRYIDGVNLNPRNVKGGSLDVEEATTFTIFKEENDTLAIDQIPSPQKDILARKTGEQQFGTIHGLIKDTSGKRIAKGSIILWEGGQGKVMPFEKGVYALLGLDSRTYRITIRGDGYGEIEKSLQATKGEIKNVDIIFPPIGTSKPTSSAPAKSTGTKRNKP